MFNCFPDADARAQARVGPGLATPLIGDDNAARDRMMQYNQFTRSLSGGYKWRMAVVCASYSLRTGEAIKESVVRESTEARSRWTRRGWQMAMANEFYKKQCHVWCFIVLFTFLAHFWLVICKSDPRLHYFRVLVLTYPVVILCRPLQFSFNYSSALRV